MDKLLKIDNKGAKQNFLVVILSLFAGIEQNKLISI